MMRDASRADLLRRRRAARRRARCVAGRAALWRCLTKFSRRADRGDGASGVRAPVALATIPIR